MGRPVKKSLLQQLGCSAWFTGQGGAEPANILLQKTTHKYRVESDAGPGDRVETLELVDGTPTGPGQMSIAISPQSGGTKYAKTICSNQIKTFDGSRYVWPNTGQGSASGLEEANIQPADEEGGGAMQFMSYYDSVYDAANDRILLTAHNEFFDPPLGSFIVYSDDGGATFTQTLLFAPDIDDFVEQWHLINDAANNEYIAIAARSNGKNRVIVANHSNPDSWTVRSTMSVLDDFDDIHYVAHNGSGTIVCVGVRGSNSDDLFVMRSTDSGASWTLVDYDETVFSTGWSNPPSGFNWNGLVYDGSHFIAALFAFDQVDYVTWTTSSTDGSTWSDVELLDVDDLPTSIDIRTIATDGAGSVIVIGKSDDDSLFSVFRSTDNGATWTRTDNAGAGVDQTIVNVIHDSTNNRYVMKTYDGNLGVDNFYSSNANGTSWTFEISAGEGFFDVPSTMTYVSSSDLYAIGGTFVVGTLDSAFTGFTEPTLP